MSTPFPSANTMANLGPTCSTRQCKKYLKNSGDRSTNTLIEVLHIYLIMRTLFNETPIPGHPPTTPIHEAQNKQSRLKSCFLKLKHSAIHE